MAEPTNNQMAFWEAMKQKYERRNESLKQQEACLRKRLDQLKEIMEKQKAGDDCDCVPEKLEKPSLVQCLVEKGRSLILGSCKCVDPKAGENFLCACHIEDQSSPLNVDSNLCQKQEPYPAPEGCLNPTCDFYDPKLADLAENPSLFSLKPTDMYYMDRLAELVKLEKQMQDKIEDLEKREHSYLVGIHDLQEAMKKQPKQCKDFKKLTEGLEEENKKLRNELEDLRLELKHCFERIEGPLKRNLEDQKNKCTNLENELKDLQAKTKSKEDSYMKEINEVKAKLCQACCTLVDLNNVNSKLKNDLASLQNKCTSLEDELLRQQLKEAENIMKFKRAICRRNQKNKIQAKGDESEQDLGDIAKKLGDTLKEVCPFVSDVPSGLKETAENIRQLTELVGEKGAQQRKRRKGIVQQLVTTSCSCGSDIIEPVKSDIQHKAQDVESCACSNSSLRLKPRIGKKDFSEDQFGDSSSATLASIPTMNMGVPKYTSTPISNPKKVLSKGCSCCPAANDCDQANTQQESSATLGRSSDVDNKKIGPSEEVIAVKNLGTLSMPTTEVTSAHDPNLTKSRRQKLAIDTTVDVLDVPPRDIHLVTTIAKTGSLEITTEGPPGIVQTKVNYLPDGKIEIVTKLVDRHHMDDFLDGTLIQLPGSSENGNSQGQFEDGDIPGCPEVDCDNSKTCGICSEKIDEPTDEIEKEELLMKNYESPYGQSVINNNFTILECKAKDIFMTKEWKNSNFNKTDEDSPKDIKLIPKSKCKRQEKCVIHEDILSQQEMLRLSSKQSLTDVEKCSTQERPVSSSGDYLLDTISEVDEELNDSSRLDSEEMKIEEIYSEKAENLSKEMFGNIKPSEGTDVVNVSSSMAHVDMSIFPVVGQLEKNQSLSISDENILKDSKLHSSEIICHQRINDEIQARSTASMEGITTNCHIAESIYKMSRNMNIFNGRVTLKQSKSMYEKSGNRSEYLRICKSATLSLGSLKIDLERLKMPPKHPNIGDFGTAVQNRSLVLTEDIKCMPISLDDMNHRLSNDAKQKVISGGPKEGKDDFFENYESIAEQTYQCYVCNCSNNGGKENQGNKNDQNSGKTPGLEQRIDRLLEIDPLATKHGVDCQCVDCLVLNAQSYKNTTNSDQKCNCTKKPVQRCKCETEREKGTIQNLKQGGDSLPHGKNCTCVDCICNPSNFKKSTNCNCKKCECDSCYGKDNYFTNFIAFELSKPPEITVMNVSTPCDCGSTCSCNPCMDESKKLQSQIMMDSERDETPCKKCSGKVEPSGVKVGSSKIKAPPKTGATSTIPTLPDTWKNVVGSTYTVPVQNEKAECDCDKCECKPCRFSEKAKKPCDCKKSSKKGSTPGSSGKCKCDDSEIGDAKHDVSKYKDPIIDLNKSIICNCKLCECLFCSDPKVRKWREAERQMKDETKTPDEIDPAVEAKGETSPDSQFKTCSCRLKCLCNPCRAFNEQMEENIPRNKEEHVPQEVKETGDGSDIKCDCAKCECEICLNLQSSEARNKDKIEEVIAVQTMACDCITCKCAKCMGKPDKIYSDQLNKGDKPDMGKRKKCPCMQESINQEAEECDDCDICSSPEKNQKQEENEEMRMPCDCCTCVPVGDPKIAMPHMVGDADRARDEIKNVLDKIGCTCDQAEINLKPLVKQASHFESTVSTMKMKLNNLQNKCKDKDQIIDAMTNELKMRSQSGVFADLLHDLAHPKERFYPDFTRTYVCDFLPKPRHGSGTRIQQKRSSFSRFNNKLEPILELDRYLPGAKNDCGVCPKTLNASGMEIIDIRRVTIDSILMKWRSPPIINCLTGYQIFVNDELKYRVLSPNRTNAVIDSLDLSRSIEIMLYAITSCGRCEPPALAIYKI